MSDYVDRMKLVDALYAADGITMRGLQIMNQFPSADVAEVRHGRWIWDPDGLDWGIGAWRCSACQARAETWWANDRKYNPLHCSGGHFCGNCGAKIDGGADNG